MTNVYGTIVEVATVNEGENITASTSIGATAIPVEDPTTFNELGGTLIINGNSYPYTGIDETASTILLGSPLIAVIDEDDRAEIYPLAPIKTALVDLGVAESDPILVTVPHALSATLSDGMRAEGQQENILLEERSIGELYMADIQASSPIIDSGYVSTISDIIVSAADWSVTAANIRRIGKVINFQINFTRTGATVGVPANGNIANNHIGTIVEEWRPWLYFSQIGLLSGRTGRPCFFSIGGTLDGNGEILMCGIEPGGGDILTSEAFSCGGTYFQL